MNEEASKNLGRTEECTETIDNEEEADDPTKYTVRVADNFDYMDKSREYKDGEYDTWEEAVAECKEIVDICLLQDLKGGVSDKKTLLTTYKMYGDDPYIVGGEKDEYFSAWDYAEQRCEELFQQGRWALWRLNQNLN